MSSGSFGLCAHFVSCVRGICDMSGLPKKITDLDVSDIRFPTSFDEHGSDASHSAPDYSAVYVRLITDSGA